MSLVLELQAKVEREREEQLRDMASYLNSLCIETSLFQETVVDDYGRSTEETIIRVSGKSINKIRLVTVWYGTA